MKTKYFTIHGVLNFIIVDKTNFKLFDTLYTHYENFEVKKKPEKIDLIFNLGSFKPDTEGKYEVGYGKYCVAENYFYVKKESYKGANWSFEIEGISKDITTVNIDFNQRGRIFITGNVIDFIIHLKLLDKSHPIIHASGISRNDNGFVFSGRGGSGKTSIAFEFLNHGFDFLGDNYIILNKGNILNFPTSLSLFTYNLNDMVLNKLKLNEKVSINLKNLLYKISGGYAKFFTKVNPEQILDNVLISSKLTDVFLIQPIEDYSDQFSIKEIDRELTIKKILYNQMLEFTFFNQYIEVCSYFYPESQLANHWNIYQDNIRENLPKNIKFYEISISSEYNKKNIINQLKDYVE